MRSKELAVLTTLLSLSLALATVPAGAEERLRILVTNDDGIGSSGLAGLVEVLSAHAEVVVVAPSQDRSSSGAAKTIRSGMVRMKETVLEGAELAYAIEGTPADAVVFGLVHLGTEKPFDAVVAGVNKGDTLGQEALSAGVVGAALTAAQFGLPAIAVAQDKQPVVYEVAAGVALKLVQQWVEHGLEPGVVLSVNVPPSATLKPRGLVVAPLGEPAWETVGFAPVQGSSEPPLWRVKFKSTRRPSRGTDTDGYQRGEIIVTPLRLDGNLADTVGAIEGWELPYRGAAE